MAKGKESLTGQGWHFPKGVAWGEPVFDDIGLWEDIHSGRVKNSEAEETLIAMPANEEETTQLRVAEEAVSAA